MQFFAALYSIVFSGAALWAWVEYFVYSDTAQERLLPGIALNVVTLPSSLLMEKIVVLNPWLLHSSASMLSIVTALGVFQVLLVWLLAAQGAKHKTRHL